MTTIAIVGAGPGLGAASARRFAREGFDVALLARDRDRVNALPQQLRTHTGVTVMGYAVDARDPWAWPKPWAPPSASSDHRGPPVQPRAPGRLHAHGHRDNRS